VYLLNVIGIGVFSVPEAYLTVHLLGINNSTYLAIIMGLGGLSLLMLGRYVPLEFEGKVKRYLWRRLQSRNIGQQIQHPKYYLPALTFMYKIFLKL